MHQLEIWPDQQRDEFDVVTLTAQGMSSGGDTETAGSRSFLRVPFLRRGTSMSAQQNHDLDEGQALKTLGLHQ